MRLRNKIFYFCLVTLFRIPFVFLFLYTLPYPKDQGVPNIPIAMFSLVFVIIGPYEFYKIFNSKFATATSISVMGMVIALDEEKKEIRKLLDSKVTKEEGEVLETRLKNVEKDLELFKKLSEVGVQSVIPERETLLGPTIIRTKPDSYLAKALKQRLAERKIREPFKK